MIRSRSSVGPGVPDKRDRWPEIRYNGDIVVMRPAAIIPAYNAASTVAGVVADLRKVWRSETPLPVVVVDDGSTDATAAAVEGLDVILIRHAVNRGKGAALRTGLFAVLDLGCDVAVSIDADGQHLADEAMRLLLSDADPRALVIGVRDLPALGAPLPSILGNRLANFSLTVLTLLRFRDTQCGLRRYPVESTLALRTRDDRFGFESEVLLRAARAALPFVEIPVQCLYAKNRRQPTHYRRIFDTVAIIVRMHVAYLFPWVRAPNRNLKISRPPITLRTSVRQIGALWAGAVVLLLALVVLRWVIGALRH